MPRSTRRSNNSIPTSNLDPASSSSTPIAPSTDATTAAKALWARRAQLARDKTAGQAQSDDETSTASSSSRYATPIDEADAPSADSPSPVETPSPARARAPRTYTHEQRLHKQQLDRDSHRRDRDRYREAKQSLLYKLKPRPEDVLGWEQESVDRARARQRAEAAREEGLPLTDFISKDVARPWAPLDVVVEEEGSGEDAHNAGSINTTNELRRFSYAATYGLPFARDFRTAPVLGEDSDSNLVVQASNGVTVVQRFSPTSSKKARQLQDDAKVGEDLQKALFSAAPAALNSNFGGKVINCGQYFNYLMQYGWASDHEARPNQADAALHWIWVYFHEHIAPLVSLLTPDFRIALEQERDAGLSWMKLLLGEDQCAFLHKWWHLATFTQGYQVGERHSRLDKEPTILTGFGEPFVLFIAHSEGFFKTVVRPGQVVFFRSKLFHQIHPLPGAEASAAALRHWAVCLSVRGDTTGLEYGDNMKPRRRENPPQPTEEERKKYKRPRFAKRK